MISPSVFLDTLKAGGADLFVGVPDSLLQNFCAHLEATCDAKQHLIAANEGNAIAIAIGHHLASGGIPVIYMQNSGLGNAINPLTSLADAEVYRVPMLLLIGWRGEPGVKDEPQHIKQGRITQGQLDLLEIPFWVLDAKANAEAIVHEAMELARTSNAPVALLVRKDTFAQVAPPDRPPRRATLTREAALQEVLQLSEDALVIATTGKAGREVFEIRQRKGEAQRDFLTVGGMGHASSIAAGVAIGAPNKRVVCLDGDGAMLMHMGALAIIGQANLNNFTHVLLNNASHESVGGQPTVADEIDIAAIAIACGYRHFRRAYQTDQIRLAWAQLQDLQGPSLLQIDVATGSRADLGRPTTSPEQNKIAFIRAIR